MDNKVSRKLKKDPNPRGVILEHKWEFYSQPFTQVDQLYTVLEEGKSVSIARAQEIHQVLSILAQFVAEVEKWYEKLKLKIQ